MLKARGKMVSHANLQIGKDVFHVLLGRLFMAATRVVSLMVVAHILDVGNLGRFSFLIMLFVLFTNLSTMGADTAASVLVAAEPGAKQEWLGSLIVAAFGFGFISMLVFLLLYLWPGNPMFEGITRFSALAVTATLLPGQMVLSMTSYFQGRERFAIIPLSSVLQWGGYLVGILVWRSLSTHSIDGAIVAFLVPVWATCIVLLTLACHDGIPRWDVTNFRRVLSFGVMSHSTKIIGFLHLRLDMLILRLLSSAEAVGFYSIATNMTEILLYLPRAVSMVVTPRSARKDLGGSDLIGVQFWGLATIALLVGFFASSLIPVFFGPGYESAVVLVRILLPGTVCLGVGLTAMGILLGLQELRFLITRGGVVVACFLVADMLAIPIYGVIGAVVVSTVLYSLFSLLLLVELARNVGTPWRRLLDPRMVTRI